MWTNGRTSSASRKFTSIIVLQDRVEKDEPALSVNKKKKKKIESDKKVVIIVVLSGDHP